MIEPKPLHGLRPAAPRAELRDRVLAAASARSSDPRAIGRLPSGSRTWRIALATTFALHLLVSLIGRQWASELADHLGVPRIHSELFIPVPLRIELEP